MTTELQTKLERIKEECKWRKWQFDHCPGEAFRAAPFRALLVAIEALKASCYATDIAEEALEQICREWPEFCG